MWTQGLAMVGTEHTKRFEILVSLNGQVKKKNYILIFFEDSYLTLVLIDC